MCGPGCLDLEEFRGYLVELLVFRYLFFAEAETISINTNEKLLDNILRISIILINLK